MRAPFRLQIEAHCVESLDTLKAYAATCDGFPRIEKRKPNGRTLAIVGGGPSIKQHIPELRRWPGDVWAINSTGAWLFHFDVHSTFITVDPGDPALLDTLNMERAILATCCHPTLRERFKAVQYFDLAETHEGGIIGSSTTATRATTLALHMGYCEVHLFGVEGCREATQNHISHHCEKQDEIDPPLIIRAGGQDYITYLEFIGQAEYLADLINFAPDVFKDRSGGLIEVMRKHRDTWEVAAVSARLKEKLEAVNGRMGLYDAEYIPAAPTPRSSRLHPCVHA